MSDLILLAVMLLLSAFFSLSETALTTVSRVRIAHLLEIKKAGARTLSKLREDPARLLSTILVGNNIVNISASVLATTVIENYFTSLGLSGAGVIIGAAIGIMTLFILVFGEITPKTLAIKNAEALALRVAPLMVAAEWLLYPIAWLMTMISRPFIFIFGGKSPEKVPFVTEEEIKTLLVVGEKEGIFEPEERAMISSVFKFTDLTVTQVMTARDKMICLETGDRVRDAIRLIKESGHSRLPVIDQTMNNVTGVIFAKDLLEADAAEKIEEYLRPAIFIPANKKVSDLMDQMQSEYKHLAIVVDEFGHTLGLVTLEDLVEEIVGEIHDEYERKKT